MAKIQAVWAIDIGQAALKALKLAPGETPETLVAEAFDYVEYPKILSQPDADPEELVREALATFLGRNEVKGSKVAIGVSGQSGLVKFIKLPPVEKKRIPDIVKFEARQQIPFALEEVIWDYQQIGGEAAKDDDFQMAEVGLFAMKRDQVNRAITPFRNAGIEVDIVQMGPIALYNYAAFDRRPMPVDASASASKAEGDESAEAPTPTAPAEADEGSVVLIDIGVDNTDLIITDGVRIWQRNVPIGGNHFTRALTKELKLTFAKAEHLKRNATKAPDPRAVFTAMRGVFNDFSSEINRSIGFYSSVNRTAKIGRVVGLGNGFKLPGLQKFLQQNLSYEVEKLESFPHLVGDEVTTAPQFQENLMSFAVAYGLAAQGLGVGPLRTNLLPPEIEQVRMIRRKKPWALAASALLMIGFASMFMSGWAAWAKVTSPEFKSAVDRAKGVAKTGGDYKSAYDTAKGAFKTKLDEGKNLVAEGGEAVNWPQLLKVVSETMPNPAKDLGVDPDKPANVPMLSKLVVHVDAIMPIYRKELGAGWYDLLAPFSKGYLPPIDQKTPPSGDGWVIQIVGHHYNPSPIGVKGISEQEKRYYFGNIKYVEQILRRFWTAKLRYFGFTHPTLTWYETDASWTSEKGGSGPTMPTFPALARELPEAAAAGGGAGGGGGGGRGGSEAFANSGRNQMGGGGSEMGMAPPVGGGSAAFAQRGRGMGGMEGGPMGGAGAGAAAKPIKLDYLTRTNFKLELVWKPRPPEPGGPKTVEERAAALQEAKSAIDKIKAEMDAAAADTKFALKEMDEAAVAEQSKQILARARADQAKGEADAARAASTPAAAPKAAPAAPAPAPGAAKT